MITIVEDLKRVGGGSQARLMRADDGKLYVVKFKNNPQDLRVLANEMLATRLGAAIGLRMPAGVVLTLPDGIDSAVLSLTSKEIRCEPGLSYGSEYLSGQLADCLPESELVEVANLNEFAGMLAFDKWLCNADGRQAVFARAPRGRQVAHFIDHGYCFNAGEWSFPDAPLRGAYAWNLVYHGVTGWGSFEPWLSRIETFDESLLWKFCTELPPEWYGGEESELSQLAANLLDRRGRVRQLITDFRRSARGGVALANWPEVPSTQLFGRGGNDGVSLPVFGGD